MDLENRILEKETDFFNTEVRNPKYIIMRPDAKEELKFLYYERQGIDNLDAIALPFNSYNGLIVAISEKPGFPDFILC